MTTTEAIAQSNNCIVLAEYEKIKDPRKEHQSEQELENEFIQDLVNNGYTYLDKIKEQRELITNLKTQLEKLNKITFSPSEWNRLLNEYINKESDDNTERSRKVHENDTHTFTLDNGKKVNVRLFDKENILNNEVQVINQFSQEGKHLNRYDVTILVNGLPMVQIELKKRGKNIREAFNQTHRYSKESFNSSDSLFKYLQIFVISNGTESLYFANTTARNQNSFDFTIEWAKTNNEVIRDLRDFTNTFLQKYTLLSVLLKYSVFDSRNVLLIMRPYQIAAAEKILNKIKSSHNNKNKIRDKRERGGYIWHTTGSGKTLTSFKTALLASKLDFIKRVFFVVDRKDLDYQTVNEYKKFSKESVTGSINVKHLKQNIENNDQKIIVTTIQKLNHLLKREDNLEVYNQEVVFIFDEAHRSQFGEAQKSIERKFKNYYQFGFTGTPIFKDNAYVKENITSNVFGEELHSYVITDAIRDKKVLSFKIDYNKVPHKLADVTMAENLSIQDDLDGVDSLENDITTPEAKENLKREKQEKNEKLLAHPKRITEVTKHILKVYNNKTHRTGSSGSGFNAMFAVSNINAAKAYYNEFKRQQEGLTHKLKIATIFSAEPNEEVSSIGEIKDESFDTADLNSTAKEFLNMVIDDYNQKFKSNFDANSQNSFQNYYRDLSLKVKNKEIDLLIVVGMFLTGFDAPTLNTLFVDKNLCYHGLIQAYSRTNRIYDSTKTAGNIVTFRNLEKETKDAIALFANNQAGKILIERSFEEMIFGTIDDVTNKLEKGYQQAVNELRDSFSDPANLISEDSKKGFVRSFGEILRIQQKLKNYDEFVNLDELLEVDLTDENSVGEVKAKYNVSDETLKKLQGFNPLSDREIQDYKSFYLKIKTEIQQRQNSENLTSDGWEEIAFEVELLKTLEVNLEYILILLLEIMLNKKADETQTVENIEKMVRSNSDNTHRNELIIQFIHQVKYKEIGSLDEMQDAYYEFARAEKSREAIELIQAENLDLEEAKRYLNNSLKHGFASENGTDLHSILPKMKISPLSLKYLETKNRVFSKIKEFVAKYTGVGGEI